jgi:ligand-binding sensor domain-containing protein/signal transduction histidine kinase
MIVPRRVRSLVLLLLFLAPAAANAERVSVTPYSVREGLAHFAVNRIVRDSRGFLWICTREGLSMYDGYGFTTYRAIDGLPSSHITDIVEAPDGLYWIGTLEGLVLFDPAAPPASRGGRGSGRVRFTTVRMPGDHRASSISSIVGDGAGGIWVGTSAGVFRIASAARDAVPTLVDLGIPDRLHARAVHALLLDRRGWLWIATGSGRLLVRRSDGATNVVDAYSADSTSVMLEDRAGRIWCGTSAGLWVFGVDTAGVPRLERRAREMAGSDQGWVRSLLLASDGSMWAATVGSLWRIDDDPDGKTVRFTAVTDLSGGSIGGAKALAEDLSGRLWVGSDLSGALRLRRAGFTPLSDPGGRMHTGPITKTANGEIAFIGLRSSDWTAWAVFCWDGTTMRAVKPGGPIGTATWAWDQALLQDSSGDWWLGTTKGIFRYAGARRCADLDARQPSAHFDSRDGLAADVAIRLFEDSRRDVWMATVGHGARPDGLSRWHRSSGTVERFSEAHGLPNFERNYVSSFAEDRSGQVWIGFSGNAGLARFRGGKFELFTAEHGLPAGQVRDLVVDSSGRLWIASFRGGVARVDDLTAQTPRFRVYTTADGLASNETYAIIPEDSGRVYIASAGGIDRLHPEKGFDQRYSQADGLPAGEINAGLRDDHGTLWFTLRNGAVRFTPIERHAEDVPRVFITGLSVNSDPQPISAVGQSSVARFSLPHDRNSLQVTFVALGPADGPEYRYRYSLDNGDPQWSDFSEARTLNFANLAPRAYRLVIEARAPDGRVTDRPAVVEFTIVAPFWQRGSFITLMLLVAGAGAYGLHRYRLRQVLAIARIRDRIATDLHDDLGANLTKIAVLGEVARQQGPRREGALASIAGIARESIANMGDIIWAIDPERDTMDDVVRKMRQHASETFADGETALTFRAPSTLDGRPVHIELRHDLFLLFKEAINNIARHARCRRVDVGLDVAGETLRLRVSDDGVGFDPDAASDGRGTGSMRKRAARMGGRLDIASVPGRGTTLELNVPLW